jgi:hypothetical protein
MRITEIRQTTVPISSSIANAYIDFSKMDVSVVAVVTDQERDGRRVVGYGFYSSCRIASSHGSWVPTLISSSMTPVKTSIRTASGRP